MFTLAENVLPVGWTTKTAVSRILSGIVKSGNGKYIPTYEIPIGVAWLSASPGLLTENFWSMQLYRRLGVMGESHC